MKTKTLKTKTKTIISQVGPFKVGDVLEHLDSEIIIKFAQEEGEWVAYTSNGVEGSRIPILDLQLIENKGL